MTHPHRAFTSVHEQTPVVGFTGLEHEGIGEELTRGNEIRRYSGLVPTGAIASKAKDCNLSIRRWIDAAEARSHPDARVAWGKHQP